MDKSRQIKKLQDRLDALKIFPSNKEVKILRERIKNQLKRLEKQFDKTPKESQKNPNKTRSSKLKRYHNYIRQIRNNFPNLTYNQIRQQFTKRRNQEDVSIPDAVWQNPSP